MESMIRHTSTFVKKLNINFINLKRNKTMSILSTSGVLTQGSVVLSSISANQNKINDIQGTLTSGKNMLDPAQQGVVTRLSSQVTGYNATQNNIAKAQNVLGVTQSGLKQIASVLSQLQDLANKANDTALTASDATKLNKTFQALLKQIDTLALTSTVDGTGIIGSTSPDLNVQTGLTSADNTSLAALASDTTTLGIHGLDVSTVGGAASAIDLLKTALDTVSTNQSSVAAYQISLSSVSENNASITRGLQSTIDSIEKPNAQALQMQLQDANNQQNINYYLINQMNQESQAVLKIFQ